MTFVNHADRFLLIRSYHNIIKIPSREKMLPKRLNQQGRSVLRACQAQCEKVACAFYREPFLSANQRPLQFRASFAPFGR